MKSLLLVSWLMFLLVAAAGCGPQQASQTATQVPAPNPPAAGPPSASLPAVALPTATPEPASSLFPVTIENCGSTFVYEAPPERAVTMNQHVTEVMLALELQDHMVGTAYIDDFILPEFQAAYETVEVLAEEYPSREVLLNAEPDFIYGGFGSAFDEQNAGYQEALMTLGINSYLTHAICDEGPDSMNEPG